MTINCAFKHSKHSKHSLFEIEARTGSSSLYLLVVHVCAFLPLPLRPKPENTWKFLSSWLTTVLCFRFNYKLCKETQTTRTKQMQLIHKSLLPNKIRFRWYQKSKETKAYVAARISALHWSFSLVWRIVISPQGPFMQFSTEAIKYRLQRSSAEVRSQQLTS